MKIMVSFSTKWKTLRRSTVSYPLRWKQPGRGHSCVPCSPSSKAHWGSSYPERRPAPERSAAWTEPPSYCRKVPLKVKLKVKGSLSTAHESTWKHFGHTWTVQFWSTSTTRLLANFWGFGFGFGVKSQSVYM